MPVKKRAAKGRTFDEYMRQQLLEGPDACLLAGVGYLAMFRVAAFDVLQKREQAELLGVMRDDWRRHGPALMTWWREGGPDGLAKPWCFVAPGGPDRLPWAFQEFGAPDAPDVSPKQEG